MDWNGNGPLLVLRGDQSSLQKIVNFKFCLCSIYIKMHKAVRVPNSFPRVKNFVPSSTAVKVLAHLIHVMLLVKFEPCLYLTSSVNRKGTLCPLDSLSSLMIDGSPGAGIHGRNRAGWKPVL